MMNKEEPIYPSMVIRSQSEAIELLEKQNNNLQQRIDKAKDIIKDLYEYGNEWHWDSGGIESYVKKIEEILGGKE